MVRCWTSQRNALGGGNRPKRFTRTGIETQLRDSPGDIHTANRFPPRERESGQGQSKTRDTGRPETRSHDFQLPLLVRHIVRGRSEGFSSGSPPVRRPGLRCCDGRRRRWHGGRHWHGHGQWWRRTTGVARAEARVERAGMGWATEWRAVGAGVHGVREPVRADWMERRCHHRVQGHPRWDGHRQGGGGGWDREGCRPRHRRG